jgi:GT2 family glycosyltransferase
VISVVIPTCGRLDSLVKCLSELAGAEEILVSDDGRSDQTRDLINERFPLVKWVPGPGRGPAANRNFGAKQASGDWLAFIDDDCYPAADWVENLRRATLDADIIEGRTICPDRTNHPLEETVENLNGGLLWSCNFAIRRQIFQMLGGFDEDFLEPGGEDLEFSWRVKQKMLTVRFTPDMIVYHPARTLSLTKWVYRVFQLRWHLLYRLKVTRVSCATWQEFMNLLRVTKRAILRKERNRMNQHLFRVVLQWILLPVWVPYLFYWEFKFRKRLVRRKPDSVSAGSA